MDFFMIQCCGIGGSINVDTERTKRYTGDLSKNHPRYRFYEFVYWPNSHGLLISSPKLKFEKRI